MNTPNNSIPRAIPPIPGGGSWTFNEEQWAWISNDPATAQAPVEAGQAEAGNDQAVISATDQE